MTVPQFDERFTAVLPTRRRWELVVFALLAIVVWPVVAVGVVGGWGFVVWMFQQVYGPPGPPHP
jgi:nitrate reductase NapE